MSLSRSKSYFSAGLFGVAALALTSCQFGNRTTTVLTGYDTISGYYATLPQTINFHAQVGSANRNQAGLVNQMPDYLKAIFANPTMLYYDAPTEGIGSLRSHIDTAIGFQTRIQDRESTFGASSSASAVVSGCRLLEETVHSGAFTQSATTTVIDGFAARGRISVDYAITYSLIGDDIDCDAMRATFKSCYADNIGCSAEGSSIFYRPFVQQLFSPLVAVGIITESDIATTRSFGYHATYE